MLNHYFEMSCHKVGKLNNFSGIKFHELDETPVEAKKIWLLKLAKMREEIIQLETDGLKVKKLTNRKVGILKSLFSERVSLIHKCSEI